MSKKLADRNPHHLLEAAMFQAAGLAVTLDELAELADGYTDLSKKAGKIHEKLLELMELDEREMRARG